MNNDSLSMQELKYLSLQNSTAKSVLKELKDRNSDLLQLKEELLILNKKLFYYDTIDEIIEGIHQKKEYTIDSLITFLKTLNSAFDHFSQENSFDYLEKTRKLIKLIKLYSYNKIIERMHEMGEAFVTKEINELINLLGEEFMSHFKKEYFNKRKNQMNKKIQLIKKNDKTSIYFIVQHEISLLRRLNVENDFYFLYEPLVEYFNKLEKDDLLSFLKHKPENESEVVFNNYLKMFLEEKYGQNDEETIIEL